MATNLEQINLNGVVYQLGKDLTEIINNIKTLSDNIELVNKQVEEIEKKLANYVEYVNIE